MRSFATLLLTVLCAASAWAADTFTDAQLQEIADKVANLPAEQASSVTVVVNGNRIAVGLYKNRDGSIIVAGDNVPAGLRGTYTFSTSNGSLNVGFRSTPGGPTQNRVVSTTNQNPAPQQQTAQNRPKVLIYVGTVPYYYYTDNGELVAAGDLYINRIAQQNFAEISFNIAENFRVGPYAAY